jgi:beta-lactamase regulating signal transducer with metallopeptidase domain
MLRAGAGSPFVLGVLRPCIVLPMAALHGLAPRQLELVLLHELAHLRRWDPLVQFVQRCAEAVLFFHPAVWWVSRWLRQEREACCDAVVLRQGARPEEYVETLLCLVGGPRAERAAVAMARGHLPHRVARILGTKERVMVPWWKGTVLAGLAGFVAL